MCGHNRGIGAIFEWCVRVACGVCVRVFAWKQRRGVDHVVHVLIKSATSTTATFSARKLYLVGFAVRVCTRYLYAASV
jgi:hypothetical protein